MQFVAELKKDLAECNFTVARTCCISDPTTCKCAKTVSVADLFLRCQFIRGLKDDWMRQQLIHLDLNKFDDFVSKAVAFEASKIESKELASASAASASQNTTDINIVRNNRDKSATNRPSCSRNFQSSSYNNDRSQRNNYSRSSSRYPRNRDYSASRKQRVNYRELGLENVCLKCGRNNHASRDCRIPRDSLKCDSCHKSGHIAKVCITTLTQQRSRKNTEKTNRLADSQHDTEFEYDTNQLEVIASTESSNAAADKYFAEIAINGKNVRVEVDSDARSLILPREKFDSLNLNVSLTPSKVRFRSYSHDIIEPLGTATVTVSYKNRRVSGELFVLPNGYDPIIGRFWIRALNLSLQELDSDSHPPSINPINQIASTASITSLKNKIMHDFNSIFEQRIGRAPGIKLSLKLRPNSKPIYVRERNLPYALRDPVAAELDTLVKAGIYTPINLSDWGSPLVITPKPGGRIRLCVDYKCTVNDQLIAANFPFPKQEEVLHSLKNSRYFCTLDLYQAYLHFEVDEESAKIQAVSTHKGTFKVNRLNYGIKTAPSEFNRIMHQILHDIPNTVHYFDDIVVHGETLEECDSNLRKCLQRLSQYDLHLNIKKCHFFAPQIEYLGHVIQFNSITQNSQKVDAVLNLSRPQNIDELRRFLGLITYYSHFIPDYSTIAYPLRRLLRKDVKYSWSRSCESAFCHLKSEIASNRVVMPFNPNLQVRLTTDASPVGIAAILSHVVEGKDRPIAYASRSLTDSERNYSQLDREALAIIFGVSHFHKFLLGRHFCLVTDNEPLTRIFHPKKCLPQMTSARLLRYASYLSGFNYSVSFKRGSQNVNVDCLSRAPIEIKSLTRDICMGNEINALYLEHIFQISSENVTASKIATETATDSELQPLLHRLRNERSDEPYTVSHGIIFYQNRIYIPTSLRPTVLQELHTTHLGMTKTKQLARRYIYWPRLDADIEHLVRSCPTCAANQNNPPKVPVHPWVPPAGNWSRIHIDYAGPFQGHHFLVCVDSKSKWAEIRAIRDAPTSASTIALLNNIFSFHGFPATIVSDNASIFTSDEFRAYCSNAGIIQKFIAPGHPATNGLAERNVQTLKRRLKCMPDGPIQDRLQKILAFYRATPLASGKSPSELYLNRQIRLRLDAIFPAPNQSDTPRRPTAQIPCPRSLLVGERVQTRILDTWYFGTVTEVLGSRHYIVKLDRGRKLKRHINQLRKTNVTAPPVTRESPKPHAGQRVRFAEVHQPLITRPTKPPPVSNPPPPVPEPVIAEQPEPAVPPAPVRRNPTRPRQQPSWLRDFHA